MSDDEDDPVVDEIPVFLSHELENKLFVFQFPVLPASGVNPPDIIKSQIKPENQEVVLECKLNTRTPNYDESHGEQIAMTVDKDKPDTLKSYPSGVMDSIKYESKRVCLDKDNYAMGLMKDHELHIIPIQGVVSLVPNFSFLTPELEPECSDDEEARMVRVQFARRDSEKAKKALEKSYNYFQQKSAEEPWHKTKYHTPDSTVSQLEKLKLTCRSKDEIVLSSEGYLDALVMEERMVDANPPPMPDHVLSLNSLKGLPLQMQIKLVLKEVQTISTQQLSWLTEGSDLSEVVQYAQQYAVLVQGNWVLRSDILYPEKSFSEHNGVPTEAMARARDYVLYEFNQGRVIERKNLGGLVGLPNEELKDVMAQVANLKRNKFWQFRLPLDHTFVTRFRDVHEQQNLMWEAKHSAIMASFEAGASIKVGRRRKTSESTGRIRKTSYSSDDSGNEGAKKELRRRRKQSGSGDELHVNGMVRVKQEPDSSMKLSDILPPPRKVSSKPS